MKKFISRLHAITLVAVLTMGSAVPTYAEGSRLSDIDGHWSRSIIEYWDSAGLIHGYPDGTFRPNAKITLAEYSTLVLNVLGLDPGTPPTGMEKHWAGRTVGALIREGIITDEEYKNFAPNRSATRMEMIRMAVRSTGEDLAGVDADTSYADAAQLSLEDGLILDAATEFGIVAGYPDGSVKPYASATRAESLTMLMNMDKHIRSAEGKRSNTVPAEEETGSAEIPGTEEKPGTPANSGNSGGGGGGGGGGGSTPTPATPTVSIDKDGDGKSDGTVSADDLDKDGVYTDEDGNHYKDIDGDGTLDPVIPIDKDGGWET